MLLGSMNKTNIAVKFPKFVNDQNSNVQVIMEYGIWILMP